MKIAIYLLTYLLTFSVSTCSQNAKTFSEPCFSDREVTESLDNLELTCEINGDITLLSDMDGSKRYSVCNVSDFDLENGKSYVISGKCYEIKPNERWPGTPFQVTRVKN